MNTIICDKCKREVKLKLLYQHTNFVCNIRIKNKYNNLSDYEISLME